MTFGEKKWTEESREGVLELTSRLSVSYNTWAGSKTRMDTLELKNGHSSAKTTLAELQNTALNAEWKKFMLERDRFRLSGEKTPLNFKTNYFFLKKNKKTKKKQKQLNRKMMSCKQQGVQLEDCNTEMRFSINHESCKLVQKNETQDHEQYK